MAHHPGRDVLEVGVLEDPCADLGVAPDLLPLLVVELAGLVEDLVGDPELADDAEQGAVGRAQWDEQRVLGVPRVGRVAGWQVGDEPRAAARPFDRAVGDEIGAVALEARVEEVLPVLLLAGGAEQEIARLLAPVHDGDLVVVEGRAVEVDDHGAVAQRVADDARDGLEQGPQAGARAHGAGDVQQATQLREGGGLERRIRARAWIRGWRAPPPYIGGGRRT
jgi:hypothetical protein